MIDVIKRIKLEEAEGWNSIASKIPAIKFDSEWAVQVIPPLNMAVTRFRVIKGDITISVYLDWYDSLGWYGSPYYEIYPYDDDTFRCSVDNPVELVDAIRVAIEICEEASD